MAGFPVVRLSQVGTCRPFRDQDPALRTLAVDCLHYSTILYQNTAYFQACRIAAGNATQPLQTGGNDVDEYDNGIVEAGVNNVRFTRILGPPSVEHLDLLRKFSDVSIVADNRGPAMLVGIYTGYNNVRVVMIAFRGTNTVQDVRVDFQFNMAVFLAPPAIRNAPAGLMVHTGFQNNLQILQGRLTNLLAHPKLSDLPVLFTGHSMGGALSMLAALRTVLQSPDRIVGLITFGCPRVGNPAFCEQVDNRVQIGLRLWAGRDPIVKLPPRQLNVLRGLIAVNYFETRVGHHLHLGRRDYFINTAILSYIGDHHPGFYSALMVNNNVNLRPPIINIAWDFLGQFLAWFIS